MPAVSQFFKDRLNVFSVQNNLVIPQITNLCRNGFNTPATHTSPGIANTDVIIYMFHESNTVQQYVALGGNCINEPTNLRNLVAGQTIINTANFPDASSSFNSKFAIMAHEVTHALVFLANQIKLFIDPNTGTTYNESDLFGTYNVRGTTKGIYKGPKVV